MLIIKYNRFLKDFPALKILSHAITGKNNITKIILKHGGITK